MATIDWLFAEGHAVDIILTVIVAELLWLVSVAKWQPVDATLRLAPGAMLLLALRAALTGASWPYVAIPLFLSFPLHLADLRRSARPD